MRDLPRDGCLGPEARVVTIWRCDDREPTELCMKEAEGDVLLSRRGDNRCAIFLEADMLSVIESQVPQRRLAQALRPCSDSGRFRSGFTEL